MGKEFLFGKQQRPPGDFFEITFGELIDRRAEEYGDKEALVYVSPIEKSWSYTAFRDICNSVAKSLIRLGVKKGDKVSMWGTNVPEWIFTFGGTVKIGGILVTVNTNYRSFELEYILKESDSTTLVLIDEFKGNNYLEALYAVIPELRNCKPGQLKSKKLPFLKNIVFIGEEKHPGAFTWKEFLELGRDVSDEELDKYQKAVEPHDVFNMQYTSGTTGFPKGVMLTHHNVINNGWYVGEAQNYTDAERVCIPVPFFHCFGLTMSITACVTHGATLLPVVYYDPTWVLETVSKGRATACQGVPTMWIGVLEHPDFDKYDLRHLRTGIMAGSPCPIEIMKRVTERMAPEVTISYGLTESSPVMTKTRPNDPLERRVSTVGRSLPHVEIEIRDPETGQEVPRGTIGEICCRGYLTMKGYYKMEEASEEAFYEDKFLRSGDLGTMDEEGYVNVTGRLKDMIIRGGENIYPREIEEFLYQHEKVMDVQVVGVPSLKYGEETAAFIKLRQGQEATEEEIKEFCEGKIARYKIPKYVLFVEEYPMTASGKIQKYVLREMAIKELGLEDQIHKTA
ncbi:MAG: AMP-binding protein [Dethiobacteria bacterium]